MPSLNLDGLTRALDRCELYRTTGKLRSATGLLTCSLPAAVGDHCEILVPGGKPILCEVIGFSDGLAYLVPYDEAANVQPGLSVARLGHGLTVPVGDGLLGRVLDGLGRPLDGRGPPHADTRAPVHRAPPAAMDRARIRTPFVTGQRVLDGLLTCGRGQRVGIFAGSGVGKSTTLGMIARNALSDVNVIALVGERGREVQEFIERDLGPEGLARSVVVVATSDQPALQRIKAAWVATAMAEYFREQGVHVTLMMDSVTRWAMAQREIGLTVGEPPVVKGYPPSVFALLPKLLEKAGSSAKGTITGFYTVLVDGDDVNEPIADAARSVLDGHIWLSRKLAHANHYPAIDVLGSISRLMNGIAGAEHRQAAGRLRDALAIYKASEDLISIGAYATGTNPALDEALALMPRVKAFLCQDTAESSHYEQTLDELIGLFRTEDGNGRV